MNYNALNVRRVVCVVLAAFVVTAAAAQDTLLSAYPEDGNLVIWGCAPRQSTRARELDAALSDAAWKAALFSGVHAARMVTSSEKSALFGFSADETLTIVPGRGEDVSAYTSALRYDAGELKTIGNSVFLRCVYPAKIDIRLEKTGAGNRPDWIKSIPRSNGAYTLVRGFAKRRRYTSDAIAAAYENAIAALISQTATHIESRTFGHSTGDHATETLETSAAYILSFFILEIFIDAATGDVWVLAAGKAA